MSSPQVDVERVLARLEELFELGVPPYANRPGLSAAEEAAIEIAARWMAQAGLQVSRDAIGNLFGRLPGADPSLGEVWCGSHLDTVPAGGRFDGALGVVCAIEAVAALAAAGARPARTVAAVAFRDEEGWRFGQGVFGSRAVCGRVTADDLEAVDSDGVRLADALRAVDGGIESPMRTGAALPAAFVELHIEQGPVLAEMPDTVGVVSGIVGIWGCSVTFRGRPGHAGTTPMDRRADALVAASAFVTAAPRVAATVPGGVATVGQLSVAPGAANVIPGEVGLSIDARAPDGDGLRALIHGLRAAAQDAGERSGCAVEIAREWEEPPAAMDQRVRGALARAARDRGIDAFELASGAGHDAGILAAAGVPTGMLFVASERGGLSHDPREHTKPARARRGLEVLVGALERLAVG